MILPVFMDKKGVFYWEVLFINLGWLKIKGTNIGIRYNNNPLKPCVPEEPRHRETLLQYLAAIKRKGAK